MSKMRRVMIQFPPTYLEDLDQRAAAMGLSRSELVRIGVSHWTVCDDGEKTMRQKIADRVLKR